MKNRAGKLVVTLCDQCANRCTTELITETRHKNGRAVSEIHFCSEMCRDEYYGIPDRISSEVEKKTRTEYNTLYKLACPKCIARFKKFWE